MASLAVIVILLILGGAYLASSFMKPGTTSSTSVTTLASSTSSGSSGNNSNVNAGQALGLRWLFGNFSQLSYGTSTYDSSEGSKELVDQRNVTYTVLGPATINSTEYTTVRFNDTSIGRTLIIWFDPQEHVGQIEVVGIGNSTGAQANLYALPYVSVLMSLVTISDNSSLLPQLTQISQGTMSLGPTQVVVTSYKLAGPSSQYDDLTARFAAIPGTNARLLVYLDEAMTDQTETTIQVLSLAK